MCGRFSVNGRARDQLKNKLSFIDRVEPPELWADRYNISPQQMIAVLRPIGTDIEATAMRWAFMPCFIDADSKDKPRTNARGETVATNGFFRSAFKSRRCLVPATGYYEWLDTPQGKQPYNFHREAHEPFLIAAIWETWDNRDGVTLITAAANEAVKKIHNRMPVIIEINAAHEWLTGAAPEIFLQSAPDCYFVADAVSRAVGNVRNQGAELIHPIPNN